ncbi:MAG: N-6 DNA methylase [Limnohabitans sp.]|nr:N-6 DNA methylase [Limnohabitans sp.]
MDIKQIRQILEAPYNRIVWKNFIQTQFTNVELLANEANINLGKSEFYENCLNLENYKLDEYNKIGIYEVILRSNVNLNRNRKGLRDLMNILVGQQPAIMVVFVQGDKWRFSYISKRKVKNKETDTIEDKETAPKRYTYLFGKGEKALTASIRFDRLIQKQQGNNLNLTLSDFEEAFSVEKLSKEFFAQYKEIYDDFVEFIIGKRYIKKGSKWVETTTHKAHFQLRNYFNNDEKQARDFFKRMMGRIVFLYFIQKKGWLSVPKTKQWGEGNPDYLFELYKNAKYKDSFYSEYLVPLFFDTLNNVDVQKESNEFRFPYLNGGLFDKAQDFKYDKIALPAEIFEKLFNTFNNYNFTIYEDAPDEHTVAVDPEMLGHIFENLLEDNKDKGAFYTPKDIVHYMCRESLHNYIYTYTGNEENEDFKSKLKLYNDTFDISIFEKDEIKLIDRALEDVKICDPAIGSGAFPMGLLHEIYHLKIPIEDSKGMKAKSPADLKKHIIEESIYGVDIDSGAVDIARLRFWLSLVVDEVAPQPLPNLAFKIVCANTLIPLGKPKSDLSGSLDIAKAIEKLRHDYFDASKEDKKDLERQFKNLQNKLWATAKDWVSKEDGDIYLKISEFNPFEDKSCTWFDAWWMFGVKDGFDIVIGNPPYVFARGNSFTKEEKRFYYENYKLASYQINIYPLFIEKGDSLLKDGGVLSYIVPNNWLTLNTNKDLRELILSKSNINIVNFYAKVFENASVDSSIILYTKNNSTNSKIKLIEFEKDFKLIKEEHTSYFFNKPDYIINIESLKDNTFGFVLEEIENNSNLLKDFADVKAGLQAYEVGTGTPTITKEMKDERVYHSKIKIDDTYFKYIDGRNVNRYFYTWSNEYLKYGNNLASPRKNFDLYSTERILVRQIPSKPPYCINACIINEVLLNDRNSMNVIYFKENPKYILSLLNSKLISFWFVHKFGKMQRGLFPQFKINELEIFPIKKATPSIQNIVCYYSP